MLAIMQPINDSNNTFNESDNKAPRRTLALRPGLVLPRRRV